MSPTAIARRLGAASASSEKNPTCVPAHEFERTLERALAELPADWRAAVVLRDIEGLSTEEAAVVVGLREAAYKSRLHRGRMQLRSLLEPYLGLEEG